MKMKRMVADHSGRMTCRYHFGGFRGVYAFCTPNVARTRASSHHCLRRLVVLWAWQTALFPGRPSLPLYYTPRACWRSLITTPADVTTRAVPLRARARTWHGGRVDGMRAGAVYSLLPPTMVLARTEDDVASPQSGGASSSRHSVYIRHNMLPAAAARRLQHFQPRRHLPLQCTVCPRFSLGGHGLTHAIHRAAKHVVCGRKQALLSALLLRA